MDHSPTDRRFGGLGRQGNYLPLEDFGSLPPSTPAPQETAEEFTSPSSSLASPRDLDEPGCFLVPPSDLDCRLAWKWEILSLVVSGLAIIATGIFCFIIGGTNQPAWSTSVYGLSLNAILSTFSLASKSGILFPLDEALGQLMWLAYADGKWPLADTELYNHASRGPWGAVQLLSKRGHRGITSLGGILMILSVALAVTQQQLINYRTHIDNTVDDPLNLTLVATSGHIYDSVQQASDEKDGPIQPVVEFAVSAEVFSSLNHYIVHDPLYRCDSGNCQYPVFTTLGICSDCSMNHTANYACDGDSDMCEAEYDGLTSISYKENSGDVEYRSTIVNQTAKMDDPDLSIIVRTWTLSVNDTIWPPAYKAYTCSVKWCVRSVNAEVRNSTYRETEIAVTTESKVRPDKSIIFKHGDQSFEVSENAQLAFKSLSTKMKGWSRRAGSGGNWTHSHPLFTGIAAFATADMTIGGSHMHRHKDTPIEVMADGMSNAIRNRLVIVGKMSVAHTVVEIRWKWIVYPIMVWCISVVFLMLVERKTRKSKYYVGAWKSSSIALLVCGVEPNVRNRIFDWNSDQMRYNATQNIETRLVLQKGRWTMKEHS